VAIYEQEIHENHTSLSNALPTDASDSQNISHTVSSDEITIDGDDSQIDKSSSSKNFKRVLYIICFLISCVFIYDMHIITYEYMALMDAHLVLMKQFEEYKQHVGWCSLSSFFVPKTINVNI
jgi:hypothetical protein